jgi:DNA repair exonuclease SbcCD ATPase subunit
MHIERVQIEEGFLDGLDVAFSPGLNVVIGARGTGKTSLIELVKFCLDVKGHTPETSRRSFDHALSVLGNGQVTVTISDGSRKVVVSRTAADTTPRASGPYVAPLVFSQTEIESVGLQASGRLGLLSGFAGVATDNAQESDAAAEARSLTVQSATLRRDIEEIQRHVAMIPAIDAELVKLAPSEQQLSALSAETSKRKQELDALAAEMSKKSVGQAVLDRFKQGVVRWRSAIAAAARDVPRTEQWPESADVDPMAAVRARIAKAQVHLTIATRASPSLSNTNPSWLNRAAIDHET